MYLQKEKLSITLIEKREKRVQIILAVMQLKENKI